LVGKISNYKFVEIWGKGLARVTDESTHTPTKDPCFTCYLTPKKTRSACQG
jgi:hypothetical protein